ncbi:hypothetical protein CPB86DRAFT_800365 [Serendipita vermifera]|nr:hypothetical protein CPB86DRAFT_800365 [Serendipita vermifera]
MATSLTLNATLTSNMEEQDVSWVLDISTNPFDGPTQSLEARFVDITNIPIEIWQIIIEQCVCTRSEPFRLVYWYHLEENSIDAETLTSLSHTCRFLRMLVLAMPHLWSELDCNESKGQVEAFLQRSGESPLVVILPEYFHTFDDPIVKEAEVLNNFSQVGNRVRAIKSDIPFENHHLIYSWSNLERLHIRSLSNQPHGDWDLSSYQKLQTLGWHCPLHTEACGMMRAVGFRLKCLYLNLQHGIEVVFHALKFCPNLEELVISDVLDEPWNFH